MKKMLLASTSTIHGQKYLEYLLEEISVLFKGCKNILFIPFARPSGISHFEYTDVVKNTLKKININVLDYHSDEKICTNINICDGIFTGGGNTILLLQIL